MWESGPSRPSWGKCPRTLSWTRWVRWRGRCSGSCEKQPLSHPGGVFVWKSASPYQEGWSEEHESMGQWMTAQEWMPLNNNTEHRKEKVKHWQSEFSKAPPESKSYAEYELRSINGKKQRITPLYNTRHRVWKERDYGDCQHVAMETLSVWAALWAYLIQYIPGCG